MFSTEKLKNTRVESNVDSIGTLNSFITTNFKLNPGVLASHHNTCRVNGSTPTDVAARDWGLSGGPSRAAAADNDDDDAV